MKLYRLGLYGIVAMTIMLLNGCECADTDCPGPGTIVNVQIIEDGINVFQKYEVERLSVLFYDDEENLQTIFPGAVTDTSTFLSFRLIADRRLDLVMEEVDTITLFGSGVFFEGNDSCCDDFRFTSIQANGITVCDDLCDRITVAL